MKSRSFGGLLVLLGCSAALVAVDGCTIVNGLVISSDAGPTTTTPGPDANAPLDSGDGCDHARPVPQPASPDSADKNDIVVVAKALKLSTDPAEKPFGFDLDDTCSVDPATETCIGEKPHFDPSGRGIDNNGGELFGLIKSRTDIEERVNQGILQGRNSLLIRISGYNGTMNDPAVTVSLYASPGLFDPPDSDGFKPPSFVDSEAWALDSAQFSGITDLPTTTSQGYVSNGVVVAYTSASVRISQSFSLQLESAVFSAELDLTGATPTMKSGILAGRWPASDILRGIARERTSEGGAALCDDAINYLFAKTIICGELDIRAERSTDRKGLECDAVSATLRFEAGRASLGKPREVPPDDPCPGFPADKCTGDGG